MKIVIVGAGKVGEVLCKDLSSEGYDIVLIETDKDRMEDIIDMADITGLVGNGASHDIQIEAGVEDTDIFIAVTEHDEINIIASIIAKKLGAKHTIARVRSPEYSDNVNFAQKELGITLMVNPERESAKAIMDILKFPSAYNVDTFMQGKVNIVEFLVQENSPMENLALKDIKVTDEKMLICAVYREGKAYIPNGDFVIKSGDRIHVTGTVKSINEFIINCNYSTKPIRSVLIVGGGEMSYYLTGELLSKKIRVKLIEVNEERAEYLSQAFPNAIIIYADGTDHEVLLQQRIETYDAVISSTTIDEENIVLSMFAESVGIEKNIVKISRNTLKPIAERIGLDSVITPKKIIADFIIKYVRSTLNKKGSRVENLHRIVNDEIEAIQFHITEESDAIEIPLKDLKTKPGVLVACIRRGEKIIFPGGDDFVIVGDRVLVVTGKKYFDEFDDILVGHDE